MTIKKEFEILKITTMNEIKRIIQIGGFFSFLILVSCSGGKNKNTTSEGRNPGVKEALTAANDNKTPANMHKQHASLADNFAHKDIVLLDNVYKVNENTKTELEQVIDSYLLMKDALVKEDENAVDKAIDVMSSKIAVVKPASLEGEGLKAWKDHSSLYLEKLKEMKHIKGLKNKRSYFSHISEIVYCTIKSFGLKEDSLYAVYCPMAFNQKGAYWISQSEEIHNPYMGSKMPGCGEIKEKL